MSEPGLDRHDWESEMAALEEDLHDDPGGSLAELDSLVGRMLQEAGYDIEDPLARAGEEREVVSEFLAAREITLAYERASEDLSPGDVAAALNDYRELFDHLVANRADT